MDFNTFFIRFGLDSSNFTNKPVEIIETSTGFIYEAEEEYKKENWFYSDYDGEFYEDKDDLVTYQKYNCITGEYMEKTISKDSYFDLIDNNELHLWGGLYFDVINEEVGKPYGYETLLEFDLAA